MTGTTRWPRGGRPPRALLVPAVALASLVLVWASSTGPAGLFSPGSGAPVRPSPRDSPAVTPRGSTGLPTLRDMTAGVQPSWNGSWIGELLLYALAAGLVLAALLGLRWLWTHRWRPPARPLDVEFEVLPEPDLAGAVGSDAEAQLAAVEQGGPRDGIVACWLRLEQTVASLGLPPRPSETAAELVARLLSTLDVDPRPVAALARLYGEARFSEHEMDEDARTAARSALLLLHADLRSQEALS
jgi:Domain of unknown function (DUF4129)